jgi:para-nitrobenzyl esterase
MRSAIANRQIRRFDATLAHAVTALALLITLCCATSPAQTTQDSAPRVAVTGGEIQGGSLPGPGGAVFMGIPFAQPPIGNLRWREPMPVKPWSGVRGALSYGSPCVQIGRQSPSGSEDCLYLNVWTPEWPVRSRLPVMLWIFGGANAVGSASNPGFDGANLARRGVVVVTANYRVGAMGFMAHPELSAESPHHASGNYCLLDVIMTLRWIQENAARFGGDPHKVTLFGQSSGSFDIQVLMASPLSKGLFHYAIAESGQMTSFGGTMVRGRAEQIGEKIADALNAPKGKDAVAFLRGLPAEEVVTVAAPFLPTDLDSDTGLLTSVDGWVLPRHPAQVFAEGKELPIPLIVGNNAREITQQMTNADLRKAIEKKYGPTRAAKAFQVYGIAGDTEPIPDPLFGAPGAQWMTDIVQRCGTVTTSRYHSAAHHPTYQYQFDRLTPGRESAGSTHGAEVVYVFGNMDLPGNTVAWSDSDRKASDVVQQYWTNFAKTGNPNGGSLPEWPRYEPVTARYLEFTAAGPVVNANLLPAHCDLFREWVRQHMLGAK